MGFSDGQIERRLDRKLESIRRETKQLEEMRGEFPPLYTATVRIMNSYNYGHFEVTLSSDRPVTVEYVNAMRVEAQKLVDQAIEAHKQQEHEREQRDFQGGDIPF